MPVDGGRGAVTDVLAQRHHSSASLSTSVHDDVRWFRPNTDNMLHEFVAVLYIKV